MAKLGTQSTLVRRQRAANHGISESQFDETWLETVTDDEFNSILLTDKKEKQKSWQDNQVKPVYIVNESGMVLMKNKKMGQLLQHWD